MLDAPPSVAAWRERFSNFRVFDGADVLPLLGSELRRKLYSQITLPACKSDIAHFVLLREYGGLYVDAHMGPSDGDRLAETLEALASFELVVFCRTHMAKTEEELHLMNWAFAARRKAAVLDALINYAFDHLLQPELAEHATSEHIHDTLWGVTGTLMLLKCFFNTSSKPYNLRPEFMGRILMHKMTDAASPGFKVYQVGYREPEQYWSERQS
jgi:hypothetical protein